MDSNVKVFRLNLKKVWQYYVGFVICFLTFAIITLELFFLKGPFIVHLMLFVIALLCFFYSSYILLFLITTKLTISDIGVTYKQPMYFFYSEWKYIKVMYVKDCLYFAIVEEFAQIHIGLIEKIFINQQNTWLNYFVDRFDKFVYWQVDPVLIELQKHIPNLFDAVQEEFSKKSDEI